MRRLSDKAERTVRLASVGSTVPKSAQAADRSVWTRRRLPLGDTFGTALLSGVAGYVDSAGYLTLFGLFTAHITGDLVTAGVALTGHFTLSDGIRLLMIPIFVASVVGTTFIVRSLQRKGSSTPAPLLAFMAAALALFCIAGILLRPFATTPNAWAVVVVGGVGVIAMGIQNTLMRCAFTSYSPTTIMTGNLTQCTIDAIELLFPSVGSQATKPEQSRLATIQRLRKFGYPLLSFMLGVFSGAYLAHVMGFACIALPAITVGAVAVETWRTSTAEARSLVDWVLNAMNLREPSRGCAMAWSEHQGSCSALTPIVAAANAGRTPRMRTGSGIYPSLGPPHDT